MPDDAFLTASTVEEILLRIPQLRIGVIGDLYLDRYFDLDARLTEPSLETGLDAYQVVGVRSYPGAAGTVVNNLSALGVGQIHPVALIGDDGEGYELLQRLRQLPAVIADGVLPWPGLRTPTYLKPMLLVEGQLPRELNRLDIHNRRPMPSVIDDMLVNLVTAALAKVDALVVLDQVSLPDCGMVTRRVRECIAKISLEDPKKPILADSREQIGLFRHVCVKPNQRELLRAYPDSSIEEGVQKFAALAGRDVFCTCGEAGILLGERSGELKRVPGYPVSGPVDPVGAGDSTSAGIICALAGGHSPAQAAAFGNLVASITVQQLGTTGTATPELVRQRWREAASKA